MNRNLFLGAFGIVEKKGGSKEAATPTSYRVENIGKLMRLEGENKQITNTPKVIMDVSGVVDVPSVTPEVIRTIKITVEPTITRPTPKITMTSTWAKPTPTITATRQPVDTPVSQKINPVCNPVVQVVKETVIVKKVKRVIETVIVIVTPEPQEIIYPIETTRPIFYGWKVYMPVVYSTHERTNDNGNPYPLPIPFEGRPYP